MQQQQKAIRRRKAKAICCGTYRESREQNSRIIPSTCFWCVCGVFFNQKPQIAATQKMTIDPPQSRAKLCPEPNTKSNPYRRQAAGIERSLLSNTFNACTEKKFQKKKNRIK